MKYIFTFIFSFLSFFPLFADETYFDKVESSAKWLYEKTNASPKLMVVLTAGVDGPIDLITDRQEISSSEIPYFPIARTQGHEGKIIFGKLNGKEIVILKGRYHYYEGLSAQDVVFPYFVLNKMGVESVITMNAVGGIRHDLDVGDIMMVTDHINYLGDNSLRGVAILHPEHQFTDMTEAYSPILQDIARINAREFNIDLKEGVYLATSGPNYETKSEIKMFRRFGADAVGMSTVFEVIACNFLRMKVLAFSCIANPAADRHEGNMNHEEVLEAMNALGPKLSKLVNRCAEKILEDN